jgi:hypothetical protein
MVDCRYTSHLKKELEQEEALLKSVKDKLVDQLQRLKVCGAYFYMMYQILLFN